MVNCGVGLLYGKYGLEQDQEVLVEKEEDMDDVVVGDEDEEGGGDFEVMNDDEEEEEVGVVEGMDVFNVNQFVVYE